jgi:uncharacterized protein (DUF488 family)
MQDDCPILTVGYGSRSIDEFVAEVERSGVEYLVDVRSAPYSRYKPEFSRDALAERLERAGIRYVFMGRELGGRPENRDHYRPDGKVDYEKRRLDEGFQSGIRALEAGWESGDRIILMCSEGKPQDCHRAKLVANELVTLRVPIAHIDERGEVRSHRDVMDSLTDGQETLFGASAPTAASRKQYRVA